MAYKDYQAFIKDKRKNFQSIRYLTEKGKPLVPLACFRADALTPLRQLLTVRDACSYMMTKVWLKQIACIVVMWYGPDESFYHAVTRNEERQRRICHCSTGTKCKVEFLEAFTKSDFDNSRGMFFPFFFAMWKNRS